MDRVISNPWRVLLGQQLASKDFTTRRSTQMMLHDIRKESERLVEGVEMEAFIEHSGGIYVARPVSEGWVLWHEQGVVGGVAAMMPAPKQSWTEAVNTAYAGRVVANIKGTCPACGATRDNATLSHEPNCSVGDSGPLADALR